jgi:non-specific serine/threonine protein kinase/serine/threonine-protein kinase
MTTEWPRVKQIAGDALDLPIAERDAFVRAASAADAALEREVRSLVASAEAAADLYETPALALPAGAVALERAMTPVQIAPGARIGAWRLVREIGHGGMGSVWLAERADGEFDQQVAIKFVGGRMAPGLLVERFRQERRILAGLEHPHIARLIDGGTTEDGWPYVVMEYVDGVPIDEFCEIRRLSTRERLPPFCDVCAAVHYAHQRLIVHRDIKASNILVTRDGTAKLLDFGIATLLEPGLSSEARAQTMLRALTPDSASPEQVRGEPITVAADVYSLGVLLHRLLTGRSPYGTAPLTDLALLKAICEQEPAAPGIDRDLDLIVLKALRKEPERRYGSAAEISDDLGRWLKGRPVQAAPDTGAYRLRKFISRHRVATAAGTIAVIAVFAGAGIAWQQGRIASAARARAERRFDDVRKLSNAFLFEVHDAIQDLPGSLPARQLVVRRATEYLDVLAAEAQDNVPLQRELATANQRLATILGGGGVSSLANQRDALPRYESALKMREALAARPDATVEDLEAIAFLRVELSRFSIYIGDMKKGEEQAAAAVEHLKTANERWPNPDRDALLATAYHQLGFAQNLNDHREAALASLERATTLARSQIDGPAPSALNVGRFARIAPDYSGALLAAKRAADAVAVARDGRARLEALIADDPVNRRYRQYLVLLLSQEADALEQLADQPDAIAAYERAAQVAEELSVQEPNDQQTQLGAMLSHCALGRLYLLASQHANGLKRLRQCVAEGERIVTRGPTNYTRGELSYARMSLGRALMEEPGAPHRVEGCALIRSGLDLAEQVAAVAPALAPNPGTRAAYAERIKTCPAATPRD